MTRSPSFASSAGRTVSEPITATSTTRIVPIPSEVKTLLPESISPPAAVITVSPETSTALPGRGRRPLQRLLAARARVAFLALALQVEERVVDADRHAHQQDHARGRVGLVDERAREVREAERGEHRGEGQQHRDPGREERAERDAAGSRT